MKEEQSENNGRRETAATVPGEIRINHSVIASIVRLSALEVEGVATVGGRFMDGVAEIFSKKESDRGVSVKENEDGDYLIDVRVLLYFGYPLAEVALQIQQNISRQIFFMTRKETAQVNVIIDGVRVKDSGEQAPLEAIIESE